jgi:hypothetical protein
MANYTITNGSTSGGGTQQATTTTFAGALIGITCASTGPRRNKIYDVLIGTNGTPADNAMEFEIARVTAASTSTTVTVAPLDPADGAAVSTVTVNSSTSGTVTVPDLFYVGINQRASYRWVAAPGSELVAPATSSQGFQLRCRSPAYTGTATGNILFQEQ